MVQFLVDLCRPSQLTTAPFLRAASIFPAFARSPLTNLYPLLGRAGRGRQDAGTSIFRRGELAPRAGAGARTGTAAGGPVALPQPSVSRRASFCRIARLWASSSSTRTSFARRVMLACATGLCLILPRASSRRGCETGTWNRGPSKRQRGYFFQRIRRMDLLRWTRCEARRPAAGGRRAGNL